MTERAVKCNPTHNIGKYLDKTESYLVPTELYLVIFFTNPKEVAMVHYMYLKEVLKILCIKLLLMLVFKQAILPVMI